VTVNFYYDTDNIVTNGRSVLQEASTYTGPGNNTELNLFTGIRRLWNTTGVPTGAYYISADINDGVMTTTWYSEVPVFITQPPSSPLMYIDRPLGNEPVGPAFQIGGWAIDQGAVAGTGVDAVHVYAFFLGQQPSEEHDQMLGLLMEISLRTLAIIYLRKV
jgi:hypothetical protein